MDRLEEIEARHKAARELAKDNLISWPAVYSAPDDIEYLLAEVRRLQAMQKWVSVEERPVPYEQPILVWLSNPILGTQAHAAFKGAGGTMIVGGHFDYDMPAITHWMPLPTPPEAP